MDELLTITAAAAALRAGTVSSVELVERAVSVADALDGRVGTFLDRYVEQSRAAAVAADELFASGADVGPLAGIPLGIKDIITTTEGPTTAQSLVHDPEWNGRRDAVVVTRLREAGGIVMGKTTTAEFAIGEPDEGGGSRSSATRGILIEPPVGPAPAPAAEWPVDSSWAAWALTPAAASASRPRTAASPG